MPPPQRNRYNSPERLTIGLFRCLVGSYVCQISSRMETIPVSMHSSRMHTACLLAVSPSMHCSGGCLLLGGVYFWGVSAPKGSGIPACTEAALPRQNDRHV